MLATFLGITGALLFGGADFVGGLAAKRIKPLVVTALSASCGLIILFALYPFLGGVWSLSALSWGVLSGITSTIALSLLYACLALGPMSILSPLTAVISAIVPLVFGLINGEKLSTFGYFGLALRRISLRTLISASSLCLTIARQKASEPIYSDVQIAPIPTVFVDPVLFRQTTNPLPHYLHQTP